MTSESAQLEQNPLLSACFELASIADVLGTVHLRQKLGTLIERIKASTLNLVVFGEFKRGKSTLINALLGDDVLPIGVVPITAVVTVIAYGDAPAAKIAFEDGKEDLLCQISSLADFVSETKNSNNEKHVQQATVFYPAPVLKQGVRIIDTPGVGSIHAHNTDVTEKFLPQCDAAVFVFAADQPATQAELEFLDRAKRYAVKFFFVQNKADYLDENEKEQSRSFVQNAIAAAFGREEELFQVSAKKALKSSDPDFDRFRTELFRFLESERSKTIQDSNSRRIEFLAAETRDFIKFKAAALSLRADEVDSATEGFASSIEELRISIERAEHIVLGRSKRIVSEISSSLDPFVRDHIDSIKTWTGEFFESKKQLPLNTLREEMISGLKQKVGELLAPWREKQEGLIRQQFTAIVGDCARESEKIEEEISALAQKFLGARLNLHVELPELTDKTWTYITVDDPFTLSIQFLPLLMSGPFAKDMMLKQFLVSAGDELVRNGGRLRADFQQRIEESTRQFLASFRVQLNAELSQLEKLLAEISILKENTTEQADRERLILKELADRLTALQRHIETESAS